MTARDGLPHAPMLALDDPSWTTLHCASGDARGIPALLAQLDGAAEDSWDCEPWQSLWSALCHRGAVYDASFAAVPHVVALLAQAPERATLSHFLLPASIELARAAHDAAIPDHLIDGYVTALARLPLLAGLVATPDWNEPMCSAALAATAAATGQHAVAALLLEADDIGAVLAWLRAG
ncbi:conserved hypothetical protein [Luteimonas sp. 9C]|uniref:hypothetical protein n=1 Tax=Luteimonas sp. 9C TaxID=2653148 RepID=UPI0012F1752D|nr:hypothetical protein [Luteimonas sp. 9C]VXC15079.1 conserved hypothetical protein [Luteimonas sp. 9C]